MYQLSIESYLTSKKERNNMSSGNVVQEVDLISLIRDIGRKNKKLQAKLLQELERRYGTLSPELRKFILDETSGHTRSIIKAVFGDIEYLLGD